MKGRKPTPVHLKLVTGNPGKRAITKAAAAEKKIPRRGVMMPPKELCDEAKVEWGRVANDLAKSGLLTDLDTSVLAAYCQSFGIWLRAERLIAEAAKLDPTYAGLLILTSNANLIQNPLVGIANKAKSDMVRFAAEFGMSPSARSRINAQAPELPEDKTAKYF